MSRSTLLSVFFFFLAPAAFAAGTDPVSTLLAGVDISGVATAIAALGVTIIAIYFGIKGISVVKRVISKI